MQRTRGALVAAVLGLALVACQPTGVARCDAHLDALALADREGYHFDCIVPRDWEPHLGWADHDTATLYVWEHRISDDRVLYKVMMHEVGHAVMRRLGNNTEQTADGWAWCAMKPANRTGISYLSKPTDCAPYLR